MDSWVRSGALFTLKRHLEFDPTTESIVNEAETNCFLKPHYRKGYKVPDTP